MAADPITDRGTFGPMRRTLGLVLAVGCAAQAADAPLTIPLGLPRESAERELHAHQYCRRPGEPAERKEVYPRCDRPGPEVSDSWVTAVYDHDRLIELRRFERFSDDARAVERWNQLVAERTKAGAPSDEAGKKLGAKGLEPGTRAFEAFYVDPQTVVGVYLLRPLPPENASVLERIVMP
jgi:hypothetical protein